MLVRVNEFEAGLLCNIGGNEFAGLPRSAGASQAAKAIVSLRKSNLLSPEQAGRYQLEAEITGVWSRHELSG